MGSYLIIGASSGIGLKTAQILHESGHDVTGTYNTNDQDQPFNMHRYDVLNGTELVVPEKLDGLVYCPGTINLKPFKMTTERDFLEGDSRAQARRCTRLCSSLAKGSSQLG